MSRSREKTLDEAWTCFDEVYQWYCQAWNPLRHCWGMSLAEPAVMLKGLLQKPAASRNRDVAKASRQRLALLKRLLAGEDMVDDRGAKKELISAAK